MLEWYKDAIIELVENCQDEDFLDFLLKLIMKMQESEGEQ